MTVRRRRRRRDRELRARPVDELVEVLVEVESSARASARTSAIFARDCATHSLAGKTIEAIANIGEQQEDDHAEDGGELATGAAPLEPFEQRHQRDRDDQRGGDRQEEFGAGAQREGKREQQPTPAISVSDASSRSRLAEMVSACASASSSYWRGLAVLVRVRPSAQHIRAGDAAASAVKGLEELRTGGSSISDCKAVAGERN